MWGNAGFEGVAAGLMRVSSRLPSSWLAITLAFALAHVWLIVASPVPPLHDYPAHLARVHIMARLADSADLRSYYEYTWMLRHNIGSDVLILMLAHVMPVEVAGRLVVAAIPAVTLMAMCYLRIKIYGRCDSLILLAAPYAMGVWFGWGFINFCLSVALALVAFALWLDVRNWKIAPRSAALLGMGFAVWLAHLSGWGVLGLLVFAWEAVAAVERRGLTLRRVAWATWSAAWRCLPLAAPLLVMALSGDGSGDLGVHFSTLQDKIDAPLQSLAFTWDRADKYCVALLVLLASAALLFRLVRVSAGLAMAAGLVFVAFVLSPAALLGGGSVDVRLLTPFALIAATALSWRQDLRAPWTMAVVTAITIALATVSGGRFAYTAAAFQRYNVEYALNLELIEAMPRGARVLGVVVDGLRSGRPPLTMLPNMAVVRRDAFSNLQWQSDAGHLLRLTYPGEAEPLVGVESTVIDLDAQGRSTGELDRLIAAEPLHRFDYVWIINTHRAAPLDNDWLELIGATDRTALYRVVEPDAV